MSTDATENHENFTLTNDSLTVTVTRKPHCQVKFDIVIPSTNTKIAYEKALKDINKEISIPGFRKGRAPESFIKDKYSSIIQKRFVELVIQVGFEDAVNLTHLHPLKEGNLKRPVVHTCSPEEGAHFTVEFESRPNPPSVKLEDLTIKKVSPHVVTDTDCQNALHNLLLQLATYDPIEGRAVQENDFINLSVVILEDPPREVISNQRVQANSTGLPIWIRRKVIGLQKGESAEGMTEQDPTLIDPTPDFQSLPFRVTVHTIWQGNLPAIDEELAKRVGLTSVDELHQKIRERLEQEAKKEAQQVEIQEIENLLIGNYLVDLPQSYIDNNKGFHLQNYLQQLKDEERDYTEKEYKEIEQMVEKQTIHSLQLLFLLQKIAADYQIEVTSEDVSQELAHQIALMQINQSTIDFSQEEKQLAKHLRHLAFNRKVKQFLVDHITKVE